MQPPELLSCGIVTFNSSSVISSCLASLRLQLPDSRILIYDNSSSDNTVEVIRRVSHDIVVFESAANLGFAASVNFLSRYVQTPYFFLLNPDATLMPSTLDELLSAASSCSDSAIIGAIQRMPSGDYVGHRPLQCQFHDVESVAGAAMLIRLKAIPDGMPLFDPRFWMYCEDVDLCFSMRRLGYRVILSNRAEIIHRPGSSSSLPRDADNLRIKRRQYIEYCISCYMLKFKHKGSLRTICLALIRMIENYAKYVILMIVQDPSRYPAYQRSLATPVFICRLLRFSLFASSHFSASVGSAEVGVH